MEQDSPPPVPRRVRPPAAEEAGPAGAESGALFQWTPPHAPIQLGECPLRALYEGISVERMVGSPTPEETDGSPRAIREVIRARLRNLIHKIRRSLTLAQRRYKRNYDAGVRPVNKVVPAGDWVFVDGRARTKYKLGTRAAGPYKVLTRGEGTFSLDIGGYPERVSSDHVTAAPGPPGDPQTLLQNPRVPQDVVVLEGHQHTGKEFFWEAFVGHEVAEDGTLRQWTRW